MRFKLHFLLALVLIGYALPSLATSFVASHQLQTCQPCHGNQGVSPNPLWPNLAGQNREYLLKQLLEIKANKTRHVPVMLGILAPLNETDLSAMADYYSRQPVSIGMTPKNVLKRGEQLYRGGDLNKQITACIACHGPGGDGNGQAGFPLLSGQYAEYTIQQLHAFKTKERKNDYNSIMRDMTQQMNDEDIQALAYYMQGLYPTDQFETCCTKR